MWRACLWPSLTEKITFQSAPTPQEFSEGDDADIVCDVVSSPPPNIIWKHKGAKIDVSKDGEPVKKNPPKNPKRPNTWAGVSPPTHHHLSSPWVVTCQCSPCPSTMNRAFIFIEEGAVLEPHGWCMKEEVKLPQIKEKYSEDWNNQNRKLNKKKGKEVKGKKEV